MSAIITLTTDYGTKDAFAASVKGVIYRITPQASLVDITHEINPQDVWEAAFTLKTASGFFPKGTIHLAVVDPGVGSGRRGIVVVTENGYYVGPDNGIFSLIYQEAERLRVHHITSTHYYLPDPGPTFHGRDIFAPVAAWLSKGIPAGHFGEEITDFVKLNVPMSKTGQNVIDGHVIHVDRFGNMITNIRYQQFQSLIPEGSPQPNVKISVMNREIQNLKKFYAEAPAGELSAIFNSNGFLELFLFKQNARTALSSKRGEVVRLTIT